MRLVDSHCHLDFPDFDDDRGELIERCHKIGIHNFVVPGVSAKNWDRLHQISLQHSEITPVYGLHPYFIDQHSPNDISQLEHLIKTLLPCAVGEIGLDYYDKNLDRVKQKTLFDSQLLLAEKYQLPVILHVRKAHDDVLAMFKHRNICGGIVHAFNGSEQQAKQYYEMGFLFGFGGVILNPNAKKIRRLIKSLPINSIVLETDAPDMVPVGSTFSRNTPLTIYNVAEAMAEIRSLTVDAIAEATTANVERVLKISF